MLERDPAAIALLERICLFRLGVEAKTLVAIFTGKDAVQISGDALAKLTAQQLQHKLNWLVRMSIIGVTRYRQSGKTRTLYNIHPAVRDGFVQRITRDIATVNHEAIRTGLEVFFKGAEKASEGAPSEQATLDFLEETIHQTISLGKTEEAWLIYQHRIGGAHNLANMLDTYDRGLRICLLFIGNTGERNEYILGYRKSPFTLKNLPKLFESPPQKLSKLNLDIQNKLLNDLVIYLDGLGQFREAAYCERLLTEREININQMKIAASLQRISQLKSDLVVFAKLDFIHEFVPRSQSLKPLQGKGHDFSNVTNSA